MIISRMETWFMVISSIWSVVKFTSTILQYICCFLKFLICILFFISIQVLDEADTMFDQGFGPDIRKFLAPLKNRAAKPGDQGFQTVLVTATMTKVSR